MKKIILSFFFTITLLGIQFTLSGQPVVNFILPDSSCVGAQINIANLTTGGSTFLWDFCSGNANISPIGANLGNPGNALNYPMYITLVQDSNECFSFISNQGFPRHVTRYYHGSSFRNNPISWATLIPSGVIQPYCEDIQIKKDNGNWYGFLNDNTTILRFDFGPSLWNNNPTITDLGITAPISVAHGLGIMKDGNTWLGFFVSSDQNTLYRLNFGNSLANIPSLEDLGNVGGFNHPCQLVVHQENGIWYILVANFNNSTISRINFGNSLLNTPTGANLGNLGGVQSPVGLTYIEDCETSTGYFSVYSTPGLLGKLIFTGGIGGTVSAQIVGNVGNLNYPDGFSEIFRQDDSLFAYLPNWNGSTLTRLSFPPCNNASIPSSNQFTPPPISYNQPGTYHVRLQVDAGLPDQAFLCKAIVIEPAPTVNLGPDRSICPGQSTTLDAGPGYTTYLWSTSATSRTITVSAAGSYWVTVTKSGCFASDTVNVLFCPITIPSIAGPGSVCTGTTGNVYTTQSGMSNYSWTVSSGGTITAGGTSTSNTVTVTWTSSGAQTVSVNFTNSFGCTAASATIFNIIVSPRPSPTIIGPAIICVGTNGNVYTTESGMTNYSWAVSSGGTITAGGTSTSNTVNVTWIATGTQTVSVNYTNLNGCTAANATVFNVIVNPRPSPTITGTAAICTGATGNVYTTESGMTNYSWSVSSGGTITGGGNPTSNTITVTWNNTGPQTVSVNYYNSFGCTAASPAVFNVTVNPLPVPSISGPVIMCVGTIGNLYTTQAGMTNYTWTVSSGGIITAGGTSTSNAVTVTWVTPGNQTISVNYSNIFGCTAATAAIFNVTVNATPTPSINGPISSCIGSTNNVYITQSGMINYSWNISSGGIITAGGTSTSNTVTVSWNTTGLQTVSVNYTDGNGCTGAAPGLVSVNVHPLPVPTLTGPQYPCVGSTGNIYSTEAGMSNYMWSVSQGGTILAGGISTDNTVTIVWNTPGLQSVLVNYTDTHDCMALAPSILIINAEPLPVPTISGPDSSCIFSIDNNYFTEPGMTSYVWTVSSGGTITSGLGTNSITVTWNSAGQQNVSVLYTDQYGCTPGIATFYYVTVDPLPGLPGNIIGPSPVCSGALGLVYTVPDVTDAISYAWTLPIGFSIVSGNGTNTIIVNVDSNASSGTILVYATNNCGSGQPSPPFPVTVNKAATGNAGPDGLTCQMIPFTITQATASNYTAIQWYSNGTGILTGSTTLSPTYTPAQGETGPVTLTMILYGNAPCGNDTSRMVINIESKATVNGGGNQSTCGQTSVLLSGSSALDYQSLFWTTSGSGFFNDPMILHPTYTPGASDINAGSVFLTLHATSEEPCEPDSDRVLLTISKPVYVNAGPDTSVCQDQLFTLNKAIANGYSKITWTTSGNGTFNDSTILNPVYTPGNEDILQGKAVLIITVQGSYPCSPATDSIVLTIIRKPLVHPGPDGAICQGMTFPVTGVTASDYNNFIWMHNGRGVLSGTTTLSPVYTPGPGETGTVIMTLSVLGNPSCSDSMASCQMRLEIYTPVIVDAGEDQTISYDTVAIIRAEANGGSGNYRYEWEPASLLLNDTSRATQTIFLKKDTIFIVTVTDEVTGCIASDSINIYVGPGEGMEGCIIIHNVITPNGDGLNDTWIIDCIENFPDNTVQIFNRWGERVNNYTHYDNKNQVWDGTNYNKELLPAGTYYYVLKIKNLKTRAGWVLLRCGLK